MPQHQVFTAAAGARRSISRIAYLIFATGAGLLACGGGVLAVTLASGSSPPQTPVAIGAGLACAGTAGLLIGAAQLFRLRQPIQVEVTPHQLIWREGRKTATLEFEDVERVDLVRAVKRVGRDRSMAYPIVRFIERSNEMIEFEVSFEERGMVHHSRFDAYAITQAAVPHVRSHALIAQSVEDFLQSGTVDIDSLPER